MKTIKVSEKSAKKLKLTVTNIKSVLIKGNKDIAKIRADQTKLANERAQLEAMQGKEKRLEKSPLKSATKKVGKKIGSATKGIFDKIMDVVMPLALTVIVNNFEEITESLRTFYENNKWIFDVIGKVFSVIGKGFMMLVNFIDGIQQNSEKKKLNEVKKDADALKESEKEVDQLEKTLKEIQKEIGIDPETGEKVEEESSLEKESTKTTESSQPLGKNLSDQMFGEEGSTERIESEKGSDALNKFFGHTDEDTNKSAEVDSAVNNETLNTINEQIKSDNPLQGSDIPSPGTLKKVEKKDPEKSLIKMERLEKTNMNQLSSTKRSKGRKIILARQVVEKPVPLEIY